MERLTKVMNCNDGNKLYDFSNEIVSECKEHSDRVKLAVKKLAEYEDLEEQGLLVKLPCKVGDTVYPIYYDYETDAYAIGKYIIYEIGIFSNEICFKREGKPAFKYSDFGKYVFLTKEEAEQALKDMESEG